MRPIVRIPPRNADLGDGMIVRRACWRRRCRGETGRAFNTRSDSQPHEL